LLSGNQRRNPHFQLAPHCQNLASLCTKRLQKRTDYPAFTDISVEEKIKRSRSAHNGGPLPPKKTCLEGRGLDERGSMAHRLGPFCDQPLRGRVPLSVYKGLLANLTRPPNPLIFRIFQEFSDVYTHGHTHKSGKSVERHTRVQNSLNFLNIDGIYKTKPRPAPAAPKTKVDRARPSPKQNFTRPVSKQVCARPSSKQKCTRPFLRQNCTRPVFKQDCARPPSK
jgi:hypothetical protein